jgi:hypothetical protein
MEYLFYFIVLVIVGLVGFFGVKFAKKYNVNKEELEFAALLIQLVNYITDKFEFKFKSGAVKIMGYVIEAIEFVIAVDDLNDGDFIRFKELVFEKAREICITEGLDIDDGLEDILSEAIVFVINNYIEVK